VSRTEPETSTAGGTPDNSNHKGKRIALLILLAALILVIVYGGLMIKHRIDYAVTDAVFVDTDRIVNSGFKKVGGRLVVMNKVEGDEIRQGELLAAIDSRDYELKEAGIKEKIKALSHRREQLELSRRKAAEQVELKIGMARDQVAGTRKSIAALRDQIAALKANIGQLERDLERYRNLYSEGVLPRRKFEVLETRLEARKKELQANGKKLSGLRSRLAANEKEVLLAVSEKIGIREIDKTIAAVRAELKALQSRLGEAELELSYCRLTSPINGRIAKKYHSIGDVVGSGSPIYALVDPHDIHILVLLGEKKLAGVEPGCSATITIDAYPDLEYEGEVDSIMPTSAAKFALVPRDISAGEFTKVVQRIPVKVKITKGDLTRLRPGMGGEIEIERRR